MEEEVESLMIKKGRSFMTRFKLNINANEFVPGSGGDVQELGYERRSLRGQNEKLYEVLLHSISLPTDSLTLTGAWLG
jgi:hypothetical protein